MAKVRTQGKDKPIRMAPPHALVRWDDRDGMVEVRLPTKDDPDRLAPILITRIVEHTCGLVEVRNARNDRFYMGLDAKETPDKNCPECMAPTGPAPKDG